MHLSFQTTTDPPESTGTEKQFRGIFSTYSSPSTVSSSSSEDEPVSSRSLAIPTGISSGSFHTAQSRVQEQLPAVKIKCWNEQLSRTVRGIR